MFTAAHGDKRRRKTGATYGKAVRRRGPLHLISGYDLSNDFREVEIELPVHSVVERDSETRLSAPNKRQSATGHVDVFDFPSDSDNEVLSPDRIKKRKLSPKAAKPAPKLEMKPQSRKTSRLTITDVDTAQSSLEKTQYRKPTRVTISPPNAKPEVRTLPRAARRAPPKMVEQYSSSTTNLIGAEKLPRPSAPNLERTLRAHAERRPPQSSAPDVEAKRQPDEIFSEGTSEAGSESRSSPRHSSPPVLTPKSAKTWKVLLGDDSETSKMSRESGKKTVAKAGRPARRRLIDTLVQQKEKPKLYNGSSQNTEAADMGINSLVHPLAKTDQVKQLESTAMIPQSLVGNVGSSAPITGGPRITYSRQRSMLAEQDELLSDIHMGSQSSQAMKGDSQHRQAFAPALLRSFDSNADEEMEDTQAPPAIRSVHELRQAGASKRFMDEIDDLSDRITAISTKPSIRRSALLELLDKVQVKTFLRNLLSSGVEQKMLATMAEERDEVSGFLLASVLLLLLDPTTTKLSWSRLEGLGFVIFCHRFLKTSDSIVLIAKQRKTNMSKMATAAMQDCQRKLLDLPLWGDVRPSTLSPQTVVLACLALALPHAHGKTSVHTLVPRDMVEELFVTLQLCAAQPLEMDDKTLQCNLLLLMSILGHIYLPHSGSSDQPQWGPEYLRNICCVATKVLAFEDTEMASLRRVVLSLTLNITNNNAHATTIFATPSFMHTILRSVIIEFERLTVAVSENERMASLDALVLMLGIMINIVEKVEDSQARILEGSSLRDALQIFSAHAEKSFEADSVEDSHFNVVFGYLAVLLGYLALMEHLTCPIRKGLPGANLKSLIDAIKEFICHHQQVDALSADDTHNHSAHTALTDRLSRMLKKVCKIEAGLA